MRKLGKGTYILFFVIIFILLISISQKDELLNNIFNSETIEIKDNYEKSKGKFAQDIPTRFIYKTNDVDFFLNPIVKHRRNPFRDSFPHSGLSMVKFNEYLMLMINDENEITQERIEWLIEGLNHIPQSFRDDFENELYKLQEKLNK